MAVLNRNSMSFSLEKKAHLVVVFLTNEPAGFSLASLRDELNSSRGVSTVLKLNRKRLAWGEKSFFDFTDSTPLPYRSVELSFVRQMFVESKYPDVLLCVVRIPKHAKFKYEIVAFRLQNDNDVRIFLDLFAALTQAPGSGDVRKVKDRATNAFDRAEAYPREPTSTLLVRARNTSAAAPAATLGKASRDHANVTWSQPDVDEFERTEERTRRRRRRNYDTVDGWGHATRVANAKVYADQTKSVVFSDAETSGTPTIIRRSDANKKLPKQSVSNGSLTTKSLSSPSIPEANYVARAVVGGSVAHVPLNDVNGFDGSDSMEEDEAAGKVGRNLQRRTTLVDNGIVKVTVEEYRDPEEEEGKTPDRSSNDQESNAYSLGAGSRFVGDSAASHPAPNRNSSKQHHHHRQLRKVDTVDAGPDVTSPVGLRRVHGRSSVQRTLSETRDNGRHNHGAESPPMNADVVYLQSRPTTAQRQRISVDNITRQPRGTPVVRNQPIRTRPESVYQLRSTTMRRQPINASATRVPDDVYQLRSATIRSPPINVMPDPVYQPRQVVLEEPGYFPERRIVRGSSVHQRNDYDRWDPVPVQQIQQPAGRSKRSSVYQVEQRTSRR